jgi:hypothetical protein
MIPHIFLSKNDTIDGSPLPTFFRPPEPIWSSFKQGFIVMAWPFPLEKRTPSMVVPGAPFFDPQTNLVIF